MLIADLFCSALPAWLMWAVQMIWIPFFAAGVINGIGHYWGYRNYDAPDASRNISPWGVLIGGEELHNNHHTYPTSAKFSLKWFEFDLGWTVHPRNAGAGAGQGAARGAGARSFVDRSARSTSRRCRPLSRIVTTFCPSTPAISPTPTAPNSAASRCPEAERARFAGLKGWLRKDDVSTLPAEQQRSLSDLMAHSRVMKTLVEMRTELAAIWSKSSASREQMLAQLQDWIARAEASRIRALEEAALRIRSYRIAAA